MPPQPAETEGKDGGEAARLKAQNKNQHGDGRCAGRGHGRHDKHEAQPQVDGQHVARFERGQREQAAGDETVEGVEALADGEEVGCPALARAHGSLVRRGYSQDMALSRPASLQKLMK